MPETIKSYRRPELGLILTQHIEGIYVSQSGLCYIAKRWQLTAEVIEICEMALDQGLVCMLQRNHPRESSYLPNGNGADYLTFSLTPEHRWVFVLDMDSCPKRSVPTRVRFSKTYKNYLRCNQVSCEPEFRSPQELHVATDQLSKALKVTKPYWSTLGKGRGKAMERSKHDFFVDEEDLHAHIIQHWDRIEIIKDMDLLESHMRLESLSHRSGEIDLLARSGQKELIVIELKNRAVGNAGGETPIEQVERYMKHPDITQKALNEGLEIRGILIAQEMDFRLRQAVAKSSFSVVAYEVTKTEAGLILSEISHSETAML